MTEEPKKEFSKEEDFEIAQKTLEETEKKPEQEMAEVLAQIEKDILEKRKKEEQRKGRFQEMEEMAEFQKRQEQEKLEKTLAEIENQKLAKRLEGKLPQMKSRQEILEQAYKKRLAEGLFTPEEVGEQLGIDMVNVLDLIEAGFLRVSRNEETGELLIHKDDLSAYLQNPRVKQGRTLRSF